MRKISCCMLLVGATGEMFAADGEMGDLVFGLELNLQGRKY